MEIADSQLVTLAAIADRGTFEAAAHTLHVTPSAVSQRMRALESSVGRVLVRRGSPAELTDAGAVLLRLARQRELLGAELRRDLAALGVSEGPETPVRLPIAVNADSLATWFGPVLSAVGSWGDVALELRVEDQGYSTELLRRGDVLGAITSDPTPVQGCSVQRIGTMRYRPAATRELAERWRRGRGYDWAAMPVVVYNDKDDLQHEVLRRRGVDRPRVEHRVPTSYDFLQAVRHGLGWGMLPDRQLAEPESAGLVVLTTTDRAVVPLHWMRWRLESPVLDRLGGEIAAACG